MNPIKSIAKALDDGWFSRILVVAQFYLAFSQTLWAQSVFSTALASIIQGAANGKPIILDLMAVAANIAAIYLGPQALLFAATKFYMDVRASQPRVLEDRRAAT